MDNKEKDYLMLKAGNKTYFFNIREAKNGKKFLVITESRFKGKDQENKRSSILVFPEYIKEFARLTTEAAEKIVKEE